MNSRHTYENPSPSLTNKQYKFQELFSSTSDMIKSVKAGELKVNLKLLPYFKDHAFKDMIVLPGSAFTEMALVIYSSIYNKVPSVIRNVKFGNLTILTNEDVILKFEVSADEDNKRIEFYEPGIESATDKSFTTTFELEDGKQIGQRPAVPGNSFTEFINNADSSLLSEEFYGRLYLNGNQYGSSFRNIKNIWLKDNNALCELDFSGIRHLSGNKFLIDPVKLDSFTHLLSALSSEEGRTFILSSISELVIYDSELPEHAWCYGKLNSQSKGNNSGFEGELKIYGDDGTLYLELSGVKFKYLNKQEQKEKPAEKTICIASTFTADPLSDSLRFWNNYFNASMDIRYAPYNQVFQELLNPQSMLASNDKGFNVILLGLEDWTRREHKLVPLVSREELDKVFNNRARYTLPNQLDIVHINKYETEYVYKEIFADKCYLKHGITLNDGDTIIDIGANIGLFTLFVNQYCKNPVVYSFEPSPVVYDLLKTNSLVYGSNVKTFNYGVSDAEKTATFTFYENSSVFSSFNADQKEDSEAIQAVVRNIIKDSSDPDDDSLDEYVKEMTEGRLESKYYECQLLSVSDIIKQNNIEKIDLLKIDAEKSELNIIMGIKDEDWSRIKQVVIEIHDKTGNVLNEIESVLKSKGFSCTVEEEKYLKDSGLFNVFAKKDSSSEDQLNNKSSLQKIEERLAGNVEYFSNSLSSFMQRSSVPVITVLTPRSAAVLSDPVLHSLYEKYESALLENISKVSNVYAVSSLALLKSYQVQNYYDKLGDELGHIPYTLPFFSSIGTTLFRLILSLQNPPKKVIALDCDNTLWKGVCGEDGVKGIQITEPYREFQKLLIEQVQYGMLICLCSKNNEEDVMEVFRQRDDMLLKLDHLVAWRTNWNNKPANLVSLAEELNLGLDSFIFIDDNPVECAEVKSVYPEVLTLQLPQEEAFITSFLKNTWVFDHLKVTEEDKKRTSMYKENLQREKYRSNALTLKDFLDGLNLNIKISAPDEEHIKRVSQLTFRTNQFNFTTIRRTEPEVREFLSDKKKNCLVAEVSDRFGDYGLVGVLFYKEEDDLLKVDTFLLSCRVLGRGVEYRFLSELGILAKEKNKDWVELKYILSPKNRPALDFIKKINPHLVDNGTSELKVKLSADYLVNLRYENFIEQEKPSLNEEKGVKLLKTTGVKDSKAYSDLSEKLQVIADELNDSESIYKKVEEFKTADESKSENTILPKTDLEKEMSLIWQRVLSRTSLSVNDNFFELGGDSLKAVQLVASVKKEMNINISIVDIFECPTVQLLAQKYSPKTDDTPSDSESVSERGSRRRNVKVNRKSRNK
jgi:FkbH-like protein/FkbM family methyltransferase